MPSGFLLACLVAVLAVYRVELGIPPTLTAREQPTYTAGSRVAVTSGERPYFRVTVDKLVEAPASGEGDEPGEILVNAAPDTNTLINAANLYPLLIESDQVAEVRREPSARSRASSPRRRCSRSIRRAGSSPRGCP